MATGNLLGEMLKITSSLTGSLLWVSSTQISSSFNSSATTTTTIIDVSRRNQEKRPG